MEDDMIFEDAQLTPNSPKQYNRVTSRLKKVISADEMARIPFIDIRDFLGTSDIFPIERIRR
jgi:hypothetical protein